MNVTVSLSLSTRPPLNPWLTYVYNSLSFRTHRGPNPYLFTYYHHELIRPGHSRP